MGSRYDSTPEQERTVNQYLVQNGLEGTVNIRKGKERPTTRLSNWNARFEI